MVGDEPRSPRGRAGLPARGLGTCGRGHRCRRGRHAESRRRRLGRVDGARRSRAARRRPRRLAHVGCAQPRASLRVRGPAAATGTRRSFRAAGHRSRATGPRVASGRGRRGVRRDERISRGEQVAVDTFDKLSLETADHLEAFIDRFEVDLGPDFRRSFETWRALANLRTSGGSGSDRSTIRPRSWRFVDESSWRSSWPRSNRARRDPSCSSASTASARPPCTRSARRIDEELIVFETTAAQIERRRLGHRRARRPCQGPRRRVRGESR